MSALHIPRRHRAPEVRFAVYDETSKVNLTSRPYVLRDSAGEFVDSYRLRDCAEIYCRALNAGRASVNPHATIGCRVLTFGYIR